MTDEQAEHLTAAINRLADAVDRLTEQSRPRTMAFSKIVYNTHAVDQWEVACGGLPNPSPGAMLRVAENI